MSHSDCIFCQIAAGRLSSVPVLRTERVYAFLDIAPVHYGHTLVIPQEHYQNFLDLPDDLWLEMGQVCRRVAQALRVAYQADGFNLGMNNFPAAGQVVFHAHLHVIPRYYDDDLQLFPQGEYQAGEMQTVGQKLRQALAGL